jgi:AraC family transcriptional regulator
MSEIAASLAVSRFQLSRIFRECTGFSLLGYRNQLRVRAALDRLSDPNARLSALAGELGYSNPSHLTAAFRNSFGLLPSELRGPVDRDTLSEVLVRHSPTTNVRLSAASGPS